MENVYGKFAISISWKQINTWKKSYKYVHNPNLD